jgi:O-antigen/teichoic acid export membrane protein
MLLNTDQFADSSPRADSQLESDTGTVASTSTAHGALLKRNIAASYAGQIYVTLIGIAVVPLYVRYMGAEAYGLIGFYAMLQSWFALLDMGLTPTMARQAARFRANAVDAATLRRLLAALETVFVAIALLGSTAIVASSTFLATHWLKVQHLGLGEVRNSLMIIGIIIGLRWVGELYRGVITGFERLVWVNVTNIASATLRFVLIIPFLSYVGARPTRFFGYQLVVAILEISVLVAQTYHLMPERREHSTSWRLDWRPLREVLHFSLALAFSGTIWALVTQTDKLLLSKLLPLSQYAYFTLGVLVAGGVMVVSLPISTAVMPRMVALTAEGDGVGLIRLYRNATQMTAVFVLPVAFVLALFSKQVLWAWTGDLAVAREVAPVLTLYALGNAIMAVGAFAYYLQFAKGDLKLHLIGSALFVGALLPALFFLTMRYGVAGAGWAWLGTNAAYFLFWVPKVHHRFVKGLHALWLLRDLAGILIATGACAICARLWITWPAGRAANAILSVLVVSGLLVVGGAASSWMRGTVIGMWRSRAFSRGVCSGK